MATARGSRDGGEGGVSCKKSSTGTIRAEVGNSQFYSKLGILPIFDSTDSLDAGLANSVRSRRMIKHSVYDGSTRFPKLDDCAHFHYDLVELGPIKVSMCEDKEDVVPPHGQNGTHKPQSYYVNVTSYDKTWMVRRTYENFRLLDKQLHKCVYDRKYSQLPELGKDEASEVENLEPLHQKLCDYLERLSEIAGSMISCGPILNWLELDNRGNRLIVTDEAAINTPAIAAAHVIKRYTAQATDELSFEVGDIVSVIDMPPPEDTVWWRGKRGFQVGFFPSDCVEVIGDKVPQSVACNIPLTPHKPVLRKRGKIISFLRMFFSTRPPRNVLKQEGIVKERVFGCDLGEHLLNYGHDVPLVLTCCTGLIENHGIVDGIYRLSGVASNIQKLRLCFDEENPPNLEEEQYLQDIHSISSLLKMYFRELPNPLFPYQLYDKFAACMEGYDSGLGLQGWYQMDASKNAVKDDENRLMKIHDVVQQLPPPHYRTAAYLIRHLGKVANHGRETGMHSKNLAIVWAPNLLRSKELESGGGAAALQGVGVQAIVTEFLIRYGDIIFSDKMPSFATTSHNGTPKRARPKSLAISTPTKLLSLEEARERALSANSPPKQKYIDVGGGPSSLPSKYHTVIEFPGDKKRGVLRKEKKSPVSGWKSIFSKGRSQSLKQKEPKGSLPGLSVKFKTEKKSVEHLRLTSHEKQALTEEDVAKRRRLRSAKSADSILSMASGFNSKRESTASQGTTIINPYADDHGQTVKRPLSADNSHLVVGGLADLQHSNYELHASDDVFVMGSTSPRREKSVKESFDFAASRESSRRQSHDSQDKLQKTQLLTELEEKIHTKSERAGAAGNTNGESQMLTVEVHTETPGGENIVPQSDSTNSFISSDSTSSDHTCPSQSLTEKIVSCLSPKSLRKKSSSNSPSSRRRSPHSPTLSARSRSKGSAESMEMMPAIVNINYLDPEESPTMSDMPPMLSPILDESSNFPYVDDSISSSPEGIFTMELSEKSEKGRKSAKSSQGSSDLESEGMEGAACQMAEFDANITDIDLSSEQSDSSGRSKNKESNGSTGHESVSLDGATVDSSDEAHGNGSPGKRKLSAEGDSVKNSDSAQNLADGDRSSITRLPISSTKVKRLSIPSDLQKSVDNIDDMESSIDVLSSMGETGKSLDSLLSPPEAHNSYEDDMETSLDQHDITLVSDSMETGLDSPTSARGSRASNGFARQSSEEEKVEARAALPVASSPLTPTWDPRPVSRESYQTQSSENMTTSSEDNNLGLLFMSDHSSVTTPREQTPTSLNLSKSRSGSSIDSRTALSPQTETYSLPASSPTRESASPCLSSPQREALSSDGWSPRREVASPVAQSPQHETSRLGGVSSPRREEMSPVHSGSSSHSSKPTSPEADDMKLKLCMPGSTVFQKSYAMRVTAPPMSSNEELDRRAERTPEIQHVGYTEQRGESPGDASDTSESTLEGEPEPPPFTEEELNLTSFADTEDEIATDVDSRPISFNMDGSDADDYDDVIPVTVLNEKPVSPLRRLNLQYPPMDDGRAAGKVTSPIEEVIDLRQSTKEVNIDEAIAKAGRLSEHENQRGSRSSSVVTGGEADDESSGKEDSGHSGEKGLTSSSSSSGSSSSSSEQNFLDIAGRFNRSPDVDMSEGKYISCVMVQSPVESQPTIFHAEPYDRSPLSPVRQPETFLPPQSEDISSTSSEDTADTPLSPTVEDIPVTIIDTAMEASVPLTYVATTPPLSPDEQTDTFAAGMVDVAMREAENLLEEIQAPEQHRELVSPVMSSPPPPENQRVVTPIGSDDQPQLGAQRVVTPIGSGDQPLYGAQRVVTSIGSGDQPQLETQRVVSPINGSDRPLLVIPQCHIEGPTSPVSPLSNKDAQSSDSTDDGEFMLRAVERPLKKTTNLTRKRSVKELMSRFETHGPGGGVQTTAEATDPLPAENDPEGAARKTVFQKPKIIKLNSLSPSGTDTSVQKFHFGVDEIRAKYRSKDREELPEQEDFQQQEPRPKSTLQQKEHRQQQGHQQPKAFGKEQNQPPAAQQVASPTEFQKPRKDSSQHAKEAKEPPPPTLPKTKRVSSLSEGSSKVSVAPTARPHVPQLPLAKSSVHIEIIEKETSVKPDHAKTHERQASDHSVSSNKSVSTPSPSLDSSQPDFGAVRAAFLAREQGKSSDSSSTKSQRSDSISSQLSDTSSVTSNTSLHKASSTSKTDGTKKETNGTKLGAYGQSTPNVIIIESQEKVVEIIPKAPPVSARQKFPRQASREGKSAQIPAYLLKDSKVGKPGGIDSGSTRDVPQQSRTLVKEASPPTPTETSFITRAAKKQEDHKSARKVKSSIWHQAELRHSGGEMSGDETAPQRQRRSISREREEPVKSNPMSKSWTTSI